MRRQRVGSAQQPAAWTPLAGLSVARLPDLGSCSAAYAFREIASGDVLYIGSTSNIRRRLFGNYIGGVGGRTTKRLHGLLFDEGHIQSLEIGVRPSAGYPDLEASLKAQYRGSHDGRLPPWNRR